MKADQSFFSSSLASVASSPWPPLIHVYGKAGTGKTWSLQNYYHRAQPRNLHFFYLDALLFTHAPSWLIWQHIECGFRTKWSGLDHATGEMPPLTGSLKSMADLVQKLKAHFDLIQKQEKALIQVHLIVDHCDALRSMENGLVLAQLMRLGEWMSLENSSINFSVLLCGRLPWERLCGHQVAGLGCTYSPLSIHFQPYTHEQYTDILDGKYEQDILPRTLLDLFPVLGNQEDVDTETCTASLLSSLPDELKGILRKLYRQFIEHLLQTVHDVPVTGPVQLIHIARGLYPRVIRPVFEDLYYSGYITVDSENSKLLFLQEPMADPPVLVDSTGVRPTQCKPLPDEPLSDYMKRMACPPANQSTGTHRWKFSRLLSKISDVWEKWTMFYCNWNTLNTMLDANKLALIPKEGHSNSAPLNVAEESNATNLSSTAQEPLDKMEALMKQRPMKPISNNLESLPMYAKYLLVAAYLASYNPAKWDAQFFSRIQSGKSKKRRGAGARSGASSQKNTINQQLLGPKPFGVDRLLAIFHHLVQANTGEVPKQNLATIDIEKLISTLCTLRYLVCTGGSGVLFSEMGVKCKCLVGSSYIRSIGHSLDLDINRYLAHNK